MECDGYAFQVAKELYSARVEQRTKHLSQTLSEKDRRRYLTLKADKQGYGGTEYIAALFAVHPKAIRQGVEELQRSGGGGRARGEDIRQLLAQQFGVDYTLNGVYELLKRLGMAWISARSVRPNANPLRQAEFKKNLVQEVQAVLPHDVTLE